MPTPRARAARRPARGRKDAEIRAEETLLGEFHTHPPIPDRPDVDFSPPSAADLYQLVVAAAQGVPTWTFVVAPEGTYECSAAPRTYTLFWDELRRFYDKYDHTPQQTHAALSTCRQPVEEYVDPRDPGQRCLARLHARPTQLFHHLIARRDLDVKAKVAHFAARIAAELAIDIRFTPADPDPA